MKWLIFLIPFIFVSVAQANDSTCFDASWKQVRYENDRRGSVTFYVTPAGYKPTATNLACIFGIEFLQTVNNVPEKAVVGLISEDYRNLTLIQWNLKDDYLLMLEAYIPENMLAWTGNYTKYPQALTRIKEIIINKPFPKPNELPRHVMKRIRINYVEATVEGNKKLVEEAQE